MATTNAQRQAQYRARQLQDIQGRGERLNTVIDVSAKYALARLAKCYGVTQREVLQRLLVQCEGATLMRLAAHPNRQTDYLEGRSQPNAPEFPVTA